MSAFGSDKINFCYCSELPLSALGAESTTSRPHLSGAVFRNEQKSQFCKTEGAKTYQNGESRVLIRQKLHLSPDKLQLMPDGTQIGKLAGVVGFEPTVHATKKRCLTNSTVHRDYLRYPNARSHLDFSLKLVLKANQTDRSASLCSKSALLWSTDSI